MFEYKFARPSVTATVLLLRECGDSASHVDVLWGTRQNSADAYPGARCLAGGFLNPKIAAGDYIQKHGDPYVRNHPGERVEETAIREVQEEVGITLDEDQLQLFHVVSDPNIDPRAHVVNVCYFAVLTPEQANSVVAGDDLQEVYFLTEEVKHSRRVEFDEVAFNHREIADRGIAQWHFWKIVRNMAAAKGVR